MFIGISGFLKSGKSEVAQMIMKFFPEKNFELVGFSKSLKQMAAIFLGMKEEDFEDQNVKANLFIHVGTFKKRWRKDFGRRHSETLYETVDTNGYPEHSWISVRVFLQDFGTDTVRARFPNAWINTLGNKYDDLYLPFDGGTPNWIVPDCRFANEALAIREREGFIIRINRKGCKATSNHASENEMTNYNFDAVINNDGSLQDLELKVYQTISKFIS